MRHAKTEFWDNHDNTNEIQVPIFRTEEVLDAFDIVDIIHIDIQGAEKCLMEPETMRFLQQHVKKLHIGTHDQWDSRLGSWVHDDLKRVFLAKGWACSHDFMPANHLARGYVTNTLFGPVRIDHDGELTLTNPLLLGL